MQKIIRKLKLSLYSKNGNKKIGVFIFFIAIILFAIFNNKIDKDILIQLVSSDMFNISGVLAGFIFTGLGMIITSNSKIILEIKETDNFCVVRNYYSGTIVYFLITILLYLFKNIVNNSGINIIFIKLYLYLIIVSFIMGIIFFAISLKILNVVVND